MVGLFRSFLFELAMSLVLPLADCFKENDATVDVDLGRVCLPYPRRKPDSVHFDGASLLQLTDHSEAEIYLLREGPGEAGDPLLIEIDQDDATHRVQGGLFICLGSECWIRMKRKLLQALLIALILVEEDIWHHPE